MIDMVNTGLVSRNKISVLYRSFGTEFMNVKGKTVHRDKASY